MELSASELGTIKRALIIYQRKLPNGLRNKGFFIDFETFSEDIVNINALLSKID